MNRGSKLFIFTFTVTVLVSLVMLPSARVDVQASAAITFPSGLTLNSLVNSTYNSNFVECNGSFTGSQKYEISLNYTIDGKYKGSIPYTFNSTIDGNYTLDWSFQLPQLTDGSHQLSIGIDQELYNNAGILINQITELNTVYFSLNLGQKTPTPTLIKVNNQILMTSLIVIVAALSVVLLIYRRHRKTANLALASSKI